MSISTGRLLGTMSSNNNLPIILVSAVDYEAALAIISELINDGSEAPQTNGVEPHSDEEADEGDGVVWRLQNKYYTASVRLLPRADTATAPPPLLDAHLIYLTEDECADDTACARRAAAAAGRLSRGAERLLAARRGSAAAAAWARAARYELVALDAAPRAPPAGPFPELAGLARLREALHAHPWPGLVLRAAAERPLHRDDSSSSSSSEDEWGEWRSADAGGEGEDEAGAVERAERFAAALALLPAARAAAGAGAAGAGGEGDASRRLRAEQLVGAFCRALGDPLPPAGGGHQ